MKNQILKISFVLIVLLFSTQNVYATSGACSSHLGVNCSSGTDNDGSVVCNDGTRDSLVPYDFMIMCKDQKQLEINNYCNGMRGQFENYIASQDQYLKSIYNMIDQSTAQLHSLDMGDPVVAREYKANLDYLYTLRDRQILRYNKAVQNSIDSCKTDKMNEYVSSLQSRTLVQKTETITCNGKEWSTCSTDSTFYCPPTGDAQCNLLPSPDQICQDSYGINSNWYGTKNDTDGLICDCKTGYIWNSQRTSCIIAPIVPVKTNDQICQDSYGINSNWYGTKNDTDGLICDCKTGYEWNQGQTQCLLTPVVPVKTNDQICSDRDSNSFFYGSFNNDGNPLCGCKTGYGRTNEGDKCSVETEVAAPVSKKVSETKNVQNEIKEEVSDNNKNELISLLSSYKEVATNIEVVKPKSFWQKILTWFGF